MPARYSSAMCESLENRQLLAEEKIAAVIDHNLQVDARHAFLHILQFHRLWKVDPIPASPVQIVTPFNLAH